MDNDAISYIGQISAEKDTWKLKGDKSQVIVKKVLMSVFENQLEEGSAVVLSKFGVGEMNDKFPIIKHSYKLIFYHQTNVKRCEDFKGPLYGFQLVDFHHIINRDVVVESTIDVMGYVVSTIEMEVFNRSGKESKGISFEIFNLSRETIACILWNNFAQQFSTFLQGYLSDGVVIVLLQFAKVQNWKGSPNIQNAFFGSRLFINVDVEEITISGRVSFKFFTDTPAALSSHTVYSSREEFLKKNHKKYAEEIWDITKESIFVVLGTIRSIEEDSMESVFVVLGTIRSVEEDCEWFYVTCSKRSKKVIPALEVSGLNDIDREVVADDVGVFYCPNCKICSPTIIPRYKIRVRVQNTFNIAFRMERNMVGQEKLMIGKRYICWKFGEWVFSEL
ncbi:uncharacterized protein LOC110933470 [Helianthus annuus]|uniref:uncharacterized protein LOC110933470 n=1 Tax=Helianthus annuus TaxID=4232 RepID=UPI000B907C13|nr:uncharacterized protein LOC110933470 [Helianthus annuus]